MILKGPVGFYQSAGGDTIVTPDLAIGLIDVTVTAQAVTATVGSTAVVCTVEPDSIATVVD